MPLVWNERTGNLVSGHQRLSVLDELEKSAEYHLDVAVVDLDEAAEREMNVFLNNQDSMGGWDLVKLEDMVKADGADLKGFGFDEVELSFLLPGAFGAAGADDPAEADAETIRKMKEARKKHKEKGRKLDDAEYYFTVVFGDARERDLFLVRAGLPAGERYLDGRRVAAAVGVNLDE
jgi:hypothetical protein